MVEVLAKCAAASVKSIAGVRPEVLDTPGRAGAPGAADAIVASESRITRGEHLAGLAVEAAKKRVTDREAAAKVRAAQEAKENEAFLAARPLCKKDAVTCKKKCDAGGDESGAYCMLVGMEYTDKLLFDEAKVAFAKACGVGFTSACPFVAKSEAWKTALEAKKKAAFADAATIVDDVASKIFIANTSAGLGGAAAARVPMMRKVIAADISERYCPARTSAVEVLGAAEFNRLAAAHCKDDPPSAQGLSGAQVSLPGECRQVFASLCP
jgi:hypothetical protein